MPPSMRTEGHAVRPDKLRSVFGTAAIPRGWGVRIGTFGYPDYAASMAVQDGRSGGYMLTPDEADQYADQLKAAAAWARAQNILDPLEG